MRWALVAVAALFAGCSSGCSGSGDSAPELSPADVRKAPDRVRAGETFAFGASYVRQLRGKPDEEYLTFEGAVDVERDSGRLEADLSTLLPTFPRTNAPVTQPVEFEWTRDELVATLDGEEATSSRSQARESGGLLGRLPDEPAALVELLSHAEDVRRAGDDEIDGQRVVRFTGSVDARRAGAAGAPAELAPAFAQALYGPKLPLEVWLDGKGLPRRIEYVVRLKPLVSGGKQLLPARSVRGRYELSGFGEPLSG